MQPRIENPAQSLPDAMGALLGLAKVAGEATVTAGLPASTVDLVETRASQINGCAVCLDMHSRAARKHGLSDQQLHTLAAWRDSPYFDEPQRAALALAEAGTRLADRPDAVPDDVWDMAAKHFDEQALAALVLRIALINAWNRLNVITGQVAGEWTAQYGG
ncbi:MAG TPA: carboxymuconolactone decarboxylase family protein [Acidimicrobiales bacterium]|nr:carboxymuconolactone decarboxylase family protein [Acidimicrobiales bacterium]